MAGDKFLLRFSQTANPDKSPGGILLIIFLHITASLPMPCSGTITIKGCMYEQER